MLQAQAGIRVLVWEEHKASRSDKGCTTNAAFTAHNFAVFTCNPWYCDHTNTVLYISTLTCWLTQVWPKKHLAYVVTATYAY